MRQIFYDFDCRGVVLQIYLKTRIFLWQAFFFDLPWFFFFSFLNISFWEDCVEGVNKIKKM